MKLIRLNGYFSILKKCIHPVKMLDDFRKSGCYDISNVREWGAVMSSCDEHHDIACERHVIENAPRSSMQ